MKEEVINNLKKLCTILNEGGETHYSDHIEEVLRKNDDEIWQYLCSNGLWGGAGSIADQALLGNSELRKKMDYLLVELGEFQIRSGQTNVRTEMWVSAFKQWK